MTSEWWSSSYRTCLVEHTVVKRVEVCFVDLNHGFSRMPSLEELGRFYSLGLGYWVRVRVTKILVLGFGNHPWAQLARQKLFYYIKDLARPNDESYRVSFIKYTI